MSKHRKSKSKQGIKISLSEISKKMDEMKIKTNFNIKKIKTALDRKPQIKTLSIDKMPEEIRQSIKHLNPQKKRFHGVKLSKYWFPPILFWSKCRNRFGYLTPYAVRKTSRLKFNPLNQNLLTQLGNLMGDSGRPTGDSNIPAGYTYFGQFVDHDVTLDISSSLNSSTSANTLNNMRTPQLDLDCLYGRGPALDPHMYVFPSPGGNPTTIKMLLGNNNPDGAGGPGGPGGSGGMVVQTDFDVPRMPGTNTAALGDPRNDENLIVSQLQHAMLKFHNQVVDLLSFPLPPGDIFVEAKKEVTHHYQWIVVHDFLKRICGNAAVNDALINVNAAVNSRFRMPVEFSVAAYRFGHSMIRNNYWYNFNFINASLNEIFQFVRNPELPVRSTWAIDFNAFLPTGIAVPVFNNARKIDSVLANGLENLPDFVGIMKILATRNLLRGLALGLPSGQALANHFGIVPMTPAQITTGLPANEVVVLTSNSNRLLNKTPLWYYILREAAVLQNGDQLGPLGAKIVADTFVRMLKRDGESFINRSGGFVPWLPSAIAGEFTLTDLINFTGVNIP